MLQNQVQLLERELSSTKAEYVARSQEEQQHHASELEGRQSEIDRLEALASHLSHDVQSLQAKLQMETLALHAAEATSVAERQAVARGAEELRSLKLQHARNHETLVLTLALRRMQNLAVWRAWRAWQACVGKAHKHHVVVELAALQTAYAELSLINSTLSSHCAASVAEAAQVTCALREVEETRDAAVTLHTTSVSRLEASNAAFIKAYDHAMERVSTLSMAVEDTNEKLAAETQSRLDLSRTHGQLADAHAASLLQQEALKAALVEQEKRNTELTQEKGDLVARSRELEARIEVITADLAAVAPGMADYKHLQAMHAAALDKVSKLLVLQRELETTRDSLVDSHTALRESHAALSLRYGSTALQLNSLKATHANDLKSLAKFNAELKASESAHAADLRVLAELKTEHAVLRETRSQDVAHQEALKAQVAILTVEVAAALTAAVNAHAEAREAAEPKMAELTTELANAKKALSESQLQHERTQALLAASYGKLSVASDALLAAETRASDAALQLAKLNELQASQAELSAKAHELLLERESVALPAAAGDSVWEEKDEWAKQKEGLVLALAGLQAQLDERCEGAKGHAQAPRPRPRSYYY